MITFFHVVVFIFMFSSLVTEVSISRVIDEKHLLTGRCVVGVSALLLLIYFLLLIFHASMLSLGIMVTLITVWTNGYAYVKRKSIRNHFSSQVFEFDDWLLRFTLMTVTVPFVIVYAITLLL